MKKTKKKVSKKVVKPLDLMSFIKSEMSDKTIIVMSEDDDSIVPWRVPFKHVGLQAATGGLIGGGIMQIEGDSMSGKSFVLYELLANCTAMGGVAYLNDPEQAYDPAFGKKVGIGKGFLYSNNNIIEDEFVRMIKFIITARSKLKDKSIPIVIGVDSFVPWRCKEQSKADEKGDAAGYGFMKKNAVYYDKLSVIQPILKNYGASLVILNQLREDRNIMFGDKDKTQAEQAKFFFNQRLRGKLGQKIVKEVPVKDGNNKYIKKVQTGMTVNWKIIKNRYVEPFKEIPVRTLFRKGLEPHSGIDRYLLLEGDIKVVERPVKLKNGENGKKLMEYYNPIGTKKLYKKENIQKMIEEHPHLVEPKWTQLVKDVEYNEVELTEEA